MVRKVLLSTLFLTVMLLGCSPAPSSAPPSTAPPSAAATLESPSHMVLATEPANAKSVIASRKDSKDGDDIVISGRIGGAVNPWIEGRAAFSIVDQTLVPCSERPGDSCTTPWDYCCDTDRLPTSLATVKFVDDQGKTVSTDARKLLGVKELQTVVVTGKAKRDEAGNLTVLATGLFVKPKSDSQ